MKYLRMFVMFKLFVAGGATYVAMWLLQLDSDLWTLLFMAMLGLTCSIGWVILYQASRSVPFSQTWGRALTSAFAFLGMLNLIAAIFEARQSSQFVASVLALGFFAMLIGLASPNKNEQIAKEKSSSISA